MTEKEYIEICILSQPKEIATKNIIQLLEQKDNKIKELNNKINKVIEYCNETIEFKDAMNERYDDCYDILKMLEE